VALEPSPQPRVGPAGILALSIVCAALALVNFFVLRDDRNGLSCLLVPIDFLAVAIAIGLNRSHKRRLEGWLRISKNRRARCVRCGYDLRGNESDICSECGLARPEDSALIAKRLEIMVSPPQPLNPGDDIAGFT
jgi:hypothetical protein